MSTAELTYRHYVPYGWIAIEFCHLSFYGDEEARRLWHKVEFSEYNKHKPSLDIAEKEVKELNNRLSKLVGARKLLRFYQFNEKKDVDAKIELLNKKIRSAEKEEKRLNKKIWKNSYTLEREAKELLTKLGYTPRSVSSSGGECGETIEMWAKEPNQAKEEE